MSVKRIVEQGNQVCFGPEKGENYIISNKDTVDKVFLEKVGLKGCLRRSGVKWRDVEKGYCRWF